MNNFNLKWFAWISIPLTIITWLILIVVKKETLIFSYDWCYELPTAISLNILFWTFFSKYWWKCKIFHPWLVPYPDLSGEWKGVIISDYIKPDTGKQIDPIPSKLKISQTLLAINIKGETNEMESNSFSSGFILDKEHNEAIICYSYTSTPFSLVRHRSPIHPGTAILKIRNNNKRLVGEYFTFRKTIGQMDFEKVPPKKVKWYKSKIFFYIIVILLFVGNYIIWRDIINSFINDQYNKISNKTKSI